MRTWSREVEGARPDQPLDLEMSVLAAHPSGRAFALMPPLAPFPPGRR
jgi:hypothetical protein